MKTKTVMQALDIAETLNKVVENYDGVVVDTLVIKNVAPLEDLKKLAKQEGGNFYAPDGAINNYCFVAVRLGVINCIIRSVDMTADEYYSQKLAENGQD